MVNYLSKFLPVIVEELTHLLLLKVVFVVATRVDVTIHVWELEVFVSQSWN